MQMRILDELQRPDLATHVQSAIQDAIKHYQRRATAENQATLSTITAVTGQRAYNLPSDFVRMIGDILVTHDGVTEPMQPRTIQEIDTLDERADDPLDGIPTYYAIYGPTPQFHIYPRSDSNSHTFGGRYVSTLAAPTEDDDEGWWMNEAERAIRCYAKAVIFDDVLQYPDQAEREFAKAEAEWHELVVEAESRAYAAGVQPWGCF